MQELASNIGLVGGILSHSSPFTVLAGEMN